MRRGTVFLILAFVDFVASLFAFAAGAVGLGIGGLVTAAALGAVGWRHRQQVFYDPPMPAPRPNVAVELPDADQLTAIPEPVQACPECGYLGIRAPTLSDGGVPGYSDMGDKRVCPRCGYQGIQVEFRTREDYVEFLRVLAEGARAPSRA